MGRTVQMAATGGPSDPAVERTSVIAIRVPSGDQDELKLVAAPGADAGTTLA